MYSYNIARTVFPFQNVNKLFTQLRLTVSSVCQVSWPSTPLQVRKQVELVIHHIKFCQTLDDLNDREWTLVVI